MNPLIRPKLLFAFVLILSARAHGQSMKLVRVVSKEVGRTTQLPGEFYPFLSVELHAKVSGYVEKVLVDRGSRVKEGELLVQLSAPEMAAHIAEAEAQVSAAESDESQAEAQAAAAKDTLARLKEAAKTSGAVAENDIVQARQQNDAAEALAIAKHRTVEALKSNLNAQRELAAYLRVTAPFAGVVTTRYVHPGALVGPGSDVPLLKLDQLSRLRLTVAVPEAEVSSVHKGASVDFKVPAYPNRTFRGSIARPAHALDMKTRTMAVELDVANAQNLLAPGMYPSVLWPSGSAAPSLLVPATSIVTTTERVFVIRDRNGQAEWVNVRRGAATDNNLVEVFGDLRPGDEIIERATDEIRQGAAITPSH